MNLPMIIYAQTGPGQAAIALVDQICNHGHIQSGQPPALGGQQADNCKSVQSYFWNHPEIQFGTALEGVHVVALQIR